MAMTWFKLHHELPGDYKLSKFSPQQKWAWIVLLCLASSAKERGVIPTTDEEGIAEHCDFDSLQDFQFFVDKLRQKGMVEPVDGGIKITNWMDRQYEKPSDTPDAVRARVQKHRSQKAEGETPCNALETPCNGQTRSDQIRLEKTREDQRRVDPFEEFKQVYNDHKPRTWTGVREINEARRKLFKVWIKTHGRREALDRLKAALLWVNRPNMSFWIQKPGQHGLISLGRSDRLFEWSEAWYEYQSGNAILGASEADASAAITHAENVVHYGAWVQEMEARHGA